MTIVTPTIRLCCQWTRLLALSALIALGGAITGVIPQVQQAYAYGTVGFAPQQVVAGQQAGQGVVFLPVKASIYAQPSTTARLIDTWSWEPTQRSLTLYSSVRKTPINASGRLLAFYPELGIAMMPALQDNGDGWVEVPMDVEGNTTGWLPLRQSMTPETLANNPQHAGVYQSWFNFMRLNARAHGIYWLAGTSAYYQALRTSPEDGSKLVPVTMIKSSRVLHARGNWLLVEAVDIGRQRPIGWVRWRNDNGDLLVFTLFNQQSNVVIPAGY